MRFLLVLKCNIKRMLKNKKNIVISLLIPSLVILILGFAFTRVNGTESESAIINSDKGKYGLEFINEIKKNTNIKVYEKNNGLEAVKNKRIPLCYEIPDNFSELIMKGEKPQIISHKLQKGTETGNFQLNANSLINKIFLRNEFKNYNKNVSLEDLSYENTKIEMVGSDKEELGDVIILNMLISFVLFGAIGISTELVKLKSQNIFKRSFTTSNSPQVIIGAVLGALFIISSVTYVAIFLVSSLLNSHSSLNKAPVIIINIIFLVLVSLSLAIFVTRVCKNENLINVVFQIIISFTCFVGGSFMPIEFLPKSISMFSKFTPQYWALRSINTNNIGLSFMVVLFSFLLFTAGTYKTKKFMS